MNSSDSRNSEHINVSFIRILTTLQSKYLSAKKKIQIYLRKPANPFAFGSIFAALQVKNL